MLHHLTAAFCLLISCSSLAAADNSFTAKAYEAGCRVIAENARPSDVVLAVKAGQCLGAVRTIELLNDSLERPRRYCAPREISLLQEIKAITVYLDAHPEGADQDFVRVAMSALNEAWPCR